MQTMSSITRPYFFPREPEFWFYHLGASIAVAAITAMSALLWQGHPNFNASLAALWLFPFTFAVLLFRWHYKKYRWQNMKMAYLVPLTVVYGAVAAILIMAILCLCLMPMFWESMKAVDVRIQTDPVSYIWHFILTGSLQLHITVCAWFILYISFSKNREIRERELSHAQLLANLREAQLSSLSSQLNPHFLFNSLNNIRFLIHENPSHADEVILALSEILRYSLESARHAKVKLAQELRIVERYLQVAKIQHEDHLHVDLQINEDLHQFLIPPMVLQMLVENAVKHGIDQLREGGCVQVVATPLQNVISFAIKNDYDPHRRAHVEGLGIGIQNIAERLRLLYGDAMQFSTAHTENTFTVAFRIPKETST